MFEKFEGYEKLNDYQKDLIKKAFLKHERNYEYVSFDKIVEIEPGEHPKQVIIRYEREWYHYEVESGNIVWY